MRGMRAGLAVTAALSLIGTADLLVRQAMAQADQEVRGPMGVDLIADFYRGKTITMLIGTGEGGGAVEDYPRALAQVMRKYIPGNPTFVVSNMPGAGGIKAANYIYSIAPQDGTYWGFITRGFMLAPLLKFPQANFDPTKFNWIGSPARSVSVGVIWEGGEPGALDRRCQRAASRRRRHQRRPGYRGFSRRRQPFRRHQIQGRSRLSERRRH